jgi:hypothetical protein
MSFVIWKYNMPRKKSIKNGAAEATTQVSTRMRTDLVKAIDDLFWQRRTDRTTELTKACEFYVSAIPCPKCATLNDIKSNYCSVCLEPMSDIAKEKDRVTGILSAIVMNDARYQKILKYAQEIADSPK